MTAVRRADTSAPQPGPPAAGDRGPAAAEGGAHPPVGPAPGDPATRRGPRVVSYRNAKFAYWSLARKPASVFHMLRVLPRFVAGAIGLLARVRWARDRRPVLAIALLEHIGDIVAAEPIARLARATYPGHRVFWITPRSIARWSKPMPASIGSSPWAA